MGLPHEKAFHSRTAGSDTAVASYAARRRNLRTSDPARRFDGGQLVALGVLFADVADETGAGWSSMAMSSQSRSNRPPDDEFPPWDCLPTHGAQNLLPAAAAVVVGPEYVRIMPAGRNAGAFRNAWIFNAPDQPHARCTARPGSAADGLSGSAPHAPTASQGRSHKPDKSGADRRKGGEDALRNCCGAGARTSVRSGKFPRRPVGLQSAFRGAGSSAAFNLYFGRRAIKFWAAQICRL